MQPELTRPYKSIQTLKTVPLPDMTILTGKNGVGKTQLLEAIASGRATITHYDPARVRLLSFNDFALQDQGVITRQALDEKKSGAHEDVVRVITHSFSHLNDEQRAKIRAVAKEVNKNIYTLTEEDFKDEKGLFFDHVYLPYRTEVVSAIDDVHTSPQGRAFARYVFGSNKKFLDEISSADYVSQTYTTRAIERNVLPSNIGMLIFEYATKIFKNDMNRLMNERSERNLPTLTDEDFMYRYGPKPWDLINDILAGFPDFPYRIIFNEKVFDPDTSRYRFFLTDQRGTSVTIKDLSSGEKTMLALAASLYNATEKEEFPRVLLLDEVDAALHPSMCINFIKLIEEVLVEKYGIKVILATHSPSTVAIAPVASTFVMTRSGDTTIIEPSSKAEALAVLSEGFVAITETDNETVIEHRLTDSPKDILFLEGKSDEIYMSEALDRAAPELAKTLRVSSAMGSGLDKIWGIIKTIRPDGDSAITQQRKWVIVHDCDRRMAAERWDKHVQLSLPEYESNPIVDGIENLLSQSLVERARQEFGDKLFYAHPKQTHRLKVNQTYKPELADWVVKNASEEEFSVFVEELRKIIKLYIS